jgi:hypothetical protein
VTAPLPGGRLSDAELIELASLLARFAVHDLDQFEHWRLVMPYGAACVTMAVRPVDGVADELYTTIWPPPDHLSRHSGSTHA